MKGKDSVCTALPSKTWESRLPTDDKVEGIPPLELPWGVVTDTEWDITRYMESKETSS